MAWSLHFVFLRSFVPVQPGPSACAACRGEQRPRLMIALFRLGEHRTVGWTVPDRFYNARQRVLDGARLERVCEFEGADAPVFLQIPS